MGAAFYEHEHRDNHVLNICNSVKKWIRNTSNVFSPCPVKPVIKKKKMNLVLKKERIFKNYYVPVAVTCIPETLQY